MNIILRETFILVICEVLQKQREKKKAITVYNIEQKILDNLLERLKFLRFYQSWQHQCF